MYMKDELLSAWNRGRNEIISGLYDYINSLPEKKAVPANRTHPVLADDGSVDVQIYRSVYATPDDGLMVKVAYGDSNLDGEYIVDELDEDDLNIEYFSLDEIYAIMCRL